MECGACAVNCPAEALTMESDKGCAVAILNEMLGRGVSTAVNAVLNKEGDNDPVHAAAGAPSIK